jgi:flagellar protein FliS
MTAYTNQYQQNQINTASPEQILLMLYDGAIRFIRRAIAAEENGKPVEKLEGISKCLAIIVEFSNTLNHDVGGEIAADLDALYQFMIRELNNARKDTSGSHMKTVETLLVDLRDTWGKAVEINRQELNEAKTARKAAISPQPAADRVYRPLVAAG